MRPIYIALFTLLTPISLFASATTSVEVSSDAYVNEINQVRNYGGSQDLFVQTGPSKNKRALIYFNFPTFPDFTEIEKAEVKVYASEIPTVQRVYNISNLLSSFIEGNGGEDNVPSGEVTWGNKPESVFLSSTTTPSVKNNFMVFDVTSFVKNTYSRTVENFGFQISDSVENEAVEDYGNFRPKEYSSVSRRPKLEITYKLPLNTISGKVFEDLNGNSLFDLGENYLPSREITLSGKVSTTTVTDSSGNFQVNSLPNGSYDLCLTLVPKDIQTFPNTNSLCLGKSSNSLVLDDTSTTTYSVLFGLLNDNKSPDIPGIVSPVSSTTLTVSTTTFSWNPVSDISSPVSYVFSYSKDVLVNASNTLLNPLHLSTTTDSFADITFNENGIYFFNIKACDSLYNCSDFSEIKNITIATTAPKVPESIKSESSSGQVASVITETVSSPASNGPIVGSSGGFFTAPQIPTISSQGVKVNESESNSFTISNTLISNNTDSVSGNISNTDTQDRPVLNTPVVRNYLNQGDPLDDSKEIKNQNLDQDVIDTSDNQRNQLSAVSESGQSVGWKVFMVLGIILVLGSVYIFTKN